METSKKDKIKNCIAIVIFVIIVSIVGILIIKYQVKGENNMPFNLSKITIISTAASKTEDENNIESIKQNPQWNLQVNQINDLYFFVDKNDEYKKEAMLESVTIENIKVTTVPEKGNIKAYMPNSIDGLPYDYKDTYLVKDSLTYTGAKESNEKNLEIGNQGGKALLGVVNTNIGTYTSSEDRGTSYDGTLITKANASMDEIKFTVNFDFIIKSRNIKYKANISLDLPCGSITEKGTEQIEKTDMSDIIFKRIK